MKIKKDKFKFSFSFNMRYWIVTLCLLFSVSLNMIGNNDHKAYTYQSFAARDFSNWPYIIETLEKEAAANPKNCAATLEIMNYYYGYIGHLLDVNNKKAADVWCKKAKKTYQALGQEYSNNADMVAYGSIITAFEIAISPVKAPLLAHSMFVGAKKSLQLDPNSIMGNLSYANFLYFFPEALGGDKSKALQHYMKVYNYFQGHPDIASQDWKYLFILSTLGVVNEKLGDIDNAKAWHKKALEVKPDFVFVKDVLVPRVNNK